MPAFARPLPVDDPDVDVALATVIADLNSALTKLTSLVSQTDGLEGLLAGTISVETTPAEVSDRTFDGDLNVLTEVEELPGGITRTWTYTYDPGNPVPLTESYVDA